MLDPAFTPGTGTPEPGGLTTRELLWALLHAAERLAVEILTGTAAKLMDR